MPDKKRKREPAIYGNYHGYYGYRVQGDHCKQDPRVSVFRREWIENRDCLDIGCNEGHVTIAIAARFCCKSMVGVDIDSSLIHKARGNLRACVEKAPESSSLGNGSEKCREECVENGERAETNLKNSKSCCWGSSEEKTVDGISEAKETIEETVVVEKCRPGMNMGECVEKWEPAGINTTNTKDCCSAVYEEKTDHERINGLTEVITSTEETVGISRLRTKTGEYVERGQSAEAHTKKTSSSDEMINLTDGPSEAREIVSSTKETNAEEKCSLFESKDATHTINSHVSSSNGATVRVDEEIVPRKLSPEELSERVTFRTMNYLESRARLESYDTILCLSITKWIHLNWGDDGLLEFFAKIFRELRPGGILILEPQPWDSYRKKYKISDSLKKNYWNLKIRPDMFTSILTEKTGFRSCEEVSAELPSDKSGFRRPLFIYRK